LATPPEKLPIHTTQGGL